MDLKTDLTSTLVCPKSQKLLIYDKDNQELIAKRSGLAYPIKEGIPIMLPDEARKLKD